MKTNYQLSVSTPFGKCQIQADSLEHLAKLTPAALSGSPERPQRQEKTPEDALVDQLLDEYRASRFSKGQRCRLSNIAKQKCEADAIRCYLDGMTMQETLRWLREKRQCNTSLSAIGRLWSVIVELPSAGKRHK